MQLPDLMEIFIAFLDSVQAILIIAWNIFIIRLNFLIFKANF